MRSLLKASRTHISATVYIASRVSTSVLSFFTLVPLMFSAIRMAKMLAMLCVSERLSDQSAGHTSSSLSF